MAQRVQAVPNPRYSTAPLETTGATIVSTRRVMVPPIIQGSFKGQRDYSGTNLNYITFQIADNECFLDNKCLFFIGDITVNGPNATDNSSNSNGRPNGRDLDIVFDQRTDAIFTQITIGSPQGLKFDEIMQYNLWSNMITLHTESSMHKERNLLTWSEFDKNTGKNFGLQHFTDKQWHNPCRIKIGESTRVAIRLDFSDFMQNIDMFPLFLLRNGLQIIMYLDSAYKVFYSPHGAPAAQDFNLKSDILSLPYIIGPGPNYYINNTPYSRASILTTNSTGANYWAPNSYLASNYTSTAAFVPCFNNLWLPVNMARNLFNHVSPVTLGMHLVPVSFYELNTIVWSGFIRIDDLAGQIAGTPINETGANEQIDQWVQANQSASGQFILGTSIVPAWAGSAMNTDSAMASLESTAQGYLPQIDVDHWEQNNAITPTGFTSTLSTISFTRFAAAGAAVTNPFSYVGFPLFSFHDQQWIPYVNYNGDGNNGSTAIATADIANAMNTIFLRGGRCVIHNYDAVLVTPGSLTNPYSTYGNALTNTTAPLAPTIANCLFSVRDPAQNGAASMLSLWELPSVQRTMRYQIDNAQLLLDLVKPAADDFLRWQQAFSSPSGIAIKFKKPIYRKLSFTSQSSGLLQIQVPINVRSLTGLIFVIQDPVLDTEPNDLLQCLALANLSTFQNRRLTEQYVQVGGQQYPVYMYQIRPDGTNRPYWEAHILELEKFFAVAGSQSFNCSLTRPMIKKTRNLIAGGYLGQSSGTVQSANLSIYQRCTYTDSSGTVYGMNLAKDWVRTFTTGIDSSQAGSIALNLYFKDPTGASNISTAFGAGSSTTNSSGVGNRSFNVHMFALCDAVATLQETANLVRF